MKGDILRGWKKDNDFMLKEFDQDGDGKIDSHEWEMARERAGKLAFEKLSNKTKSQQLHTLSKSDVKHYPFIISTIPEAFFLKEYKRGFIFGNGWFLFCSALAACLYLFVWEL